MHEDPEIDLIWAILTASAMAEPPALDFWSTIDTHRWEVRWAMAHLLKEVAPTHDVLRTLKKDPDHRVKRAAN